MGGPPLCVRGQSPKDHSKIKVSFIDTSAPADMSKWTDGEKAFYQKNGYL